MTERTRYVGAQGTRRLTERQLNAVISVLEYTLEQCTDMQSAPAPWYQHEPASRALEKLKSWRDRSRARRAA